MPCWSQRSEIGVCSRRWSRRMATFSWAVKRLRVFLGMGAPPLEVVAYSSRRFVPFQLKQDIRCRASATPLAKPRHAQGISAQLAMWTRPAPCDVTFTSRWRQRSERIEARTYSADASEGSHVDHTEARKLS